MGRPAKGWRLREKRGFQYVRFTHEGVRYDVATGERDVGKASIEAKRIYDKAIRGTLEPKTRKVRHGHAIDLFVAKWLLEMTTSLDPETVDTYALYCRKHWVPYWSNNFGEIDEKTLAEYARARLGAVTRKTVQKELSALRGLLGWAVDKGHLRELPKAPRLSKRIVGVRSGPQREKPVELSPEHVTAILEVLPEWGGKGDRQFRVRDYFVVAYETGLRPATLRELSVPENYRVGARELVIGAGIDKSRNGRTVSLTAAARAALDRAATATGPIFGKHDYRGVWKAAVRASGAPKGAAPYDLRHGRATHLLDQGGTLSGVGYLLGHTQLTTTDKYAKANRRAADALPGFSPKEEDK